MFDVRLRVFSDSAVRGRVLKTTRITITDNDSATPRVSFSVSRRVAGYLSNPFLVGVEVSYGGAWVTPRNNLFICTEESGDDSDDSETVSFSGAGFVPWLMQYMYVQGPLSLVDRTWPNATPGTIIKTLLTEAKVWGWGPSVSFDFTETHDSNGSAWTAAERTSITWRVGSTAMSDVLAALSDQGIIEWWVEGTTLRVFRAGIGTDRSSDVALGGPGFSRTPRKSSFDGVFTNLTVFYDGPKYINVTNPGSDGRFGALWATVTQSGVKTQDEAVKLSQSAMTLAKGKREELSYEWDGAADLPVPVRDFSIGDVVTARQRDGKRVQRVIGWVFHKSDDAVTVRAVVGSKLLSLTAKLAKRSASASVGTIIGGSGDAMPPHRGPADPNPLPPEGLRVVSNVGSWTRGGSAVSAVKLAWYAVSQTVDGTAVDVVEYEVWAREADQVAAFVARSRSLEALVESWRPDVLQLVSVRARSASGEWSELSAEIAVTPAMPTSIVPKAPTGLAASQTAFYSPGGSPKSRVVLSWNAVTQSTDDTPVEVVRYEVWERTGPGVSVFLTSATTTSVTFEIPSDGDRWYRVRAFSDLGFAGDLSAELKVSPSVPPVDTTPPSTPVLVSGAMTVEARWDGLMSTGDAPGSHHANTLAQWSTDGNAPWRAAGAPMSGAGSVTVEGKKGVPIFFRFVTMDTLGRVGGMSAVVSAAPVGVGVPDIDEAISDAIADAKATADGKNSIFVSDTAPAEPAEGFTAGDQWFVLDEFGNVSAIRVWNGSEWAAYQLFADSVVVPGSVTARVLNSEEIWANEAFLDKATVGVLESAYIKTPEFAQNLNIEAHGSITMIVGQLAQTESDVSDAKTAADNAQASANTANAVADGAVAQALEAFDAAAALQGDLTNMQAVYKYTPTEAIITTPNGERGLHLAPDGISMKEDGITITRWEGQQMIVQMIVVDAAKIGNHIVESNGTGRTTWRPL